jgi:glycolate oxidase iron-sulfur subunit
LAGDPKYAPSAARISAMARDLSELLPDLMPALEAGVRRGNAQRIAFHAPCTLQHGLGLRGEVERQLRALGFEVLPASDESHMCCGSAGTYSILQPDLAHQLRDRKLRNLTKLEPQYILSANIGCIQHLQSGTPTRVMHWIELLDEHLSQ